MAMSFDMRNILDVVWEKLEFGFDIILPLVAIWIFIKWIRESRRRSINDTLKSALLGNLLNMIQSLSERYVKDLVEGCLAYEKVVDASLKKRKNSDGLIDWEAMANDFSDAEISDSINSAKSARATVDDFYNTAQSYRYSIYPLLRAVGAGDYISKFDAELNEIVIVHNEIVKSIAIIDLNIKENDKIESMKYIVNLSLEFQAARIECKEVCSFLSALVEQVVKNSSSDAFEDLISEYQDQVFKTKELIR